MNIRDMIPRLDAEGLQTMRLNATRLSTSGTPKQQEQAREALVLLDEEGSRRATASPAEPPKARPKSGSDRAPRSKGKGRSTHVAS